MKFKFSAIVLATTLFSTAVYAQPQTSAAPLEDFKPSSLNQPFQDYPQVNSQGYVRFRIQAPQADSVRVTLGLGGQGGTRLTKGADGYFTGSTAGPMDEGFHYYHLIIDGGVFNDPGTGNFYGSQRWESGIEIPAHDQDFYALKDVPHGLLQQVLFRQKVRTLHVLLTFIRHRVMKKGIPNIRCYTCSTVGAKMKPRGAYKVVQTSLWTT